MTDLPKRPAERSPELLALEQEYERLIGKQVVHLMEPKNAGAAIAEFVEMSTETAETYQQTGWVKGASK